MRVTSQSLRAEGVFEESHSPDEPRLRFIRHLVSNQKSFDYLSMNVRQAEVATLVTVSQLRVLDPQ